MQKMLLSMLVMAIVVGGGAFYGGMKYQASKTTAERQSALGGQFSGPAGWQGGTAGKRLGNQPGAGLVSGEIIAKDDKSITVKLREGSKIIFYSGTTEVGKFVTSTPADLAIGQNVSVTGQAGQDGSLTAQSIQIRPQVKN